MDVVVWDVEWRADVGNACRYDVHDQQTALSYLNTFLFGFSYIGEVGCGAASEFLKVRPPKRRVIF